MKKKCALPLLISKPCWGEDTEQYYISCPEKYFWASLYYKKKEQTYGHTVVAQSVKTLNPTYSMGGVSWLT